MNVLTCSKPEGGLMFRWWLRLGASGDLARMLSPSLHGAFQFMQFFATRPMVYETDASGTSIACAAWFTPFLDGAAVGVYLEPTARRSRRGARFLDAAFSAGFQTYPVLLFWSRNPQRVQLYARFGFTVQPQPIPGLDHGQDVYYGYLTHAQHAALQASRRWATARTS